MAKTEGGLELFKNSPAAFQQVLIQFRVCHDLCYFASSEILEPDTVNKIDQCAIDFRHMAMQTATLADRISSLWCKTCLLFFRNIDKVTNYDKVLMRISDQAKDLSLGFKTIAKWCRELAGKFHDAQKLAASNSEEFQKAVDFAEEEADRLVRELKSKLNDLEIEAKQKWEEADKLRNRSSYFIIGIFWSKAASVSNKQARNAEESVRDAEKKSEEAKRQLQQAQNKQEKAQVR